MIPNLDIAPHKRELRAQLRVQLRAIAPEQRLQASACACALLRSQAIWKNAKSILFYVPFHVEINLSELIEEALAEKKTVALPRYVEETGVYEVRQIEHFSRDCTAGKFGIPEPGGHCATLSLNRLDLILTPGLGFDLAGYRLGRGRGFYDRILAEVSGIKCGVAFDEQLVERVPAETHDVRLNFIVTPTRWLEIGERPPHSK